MKFNNKYPYISIITAVRNGADTIYQTLSSVASQTYNNFEYIVVDGGSTDGTIEIIQSFSLVTAHFVSEEDSGISEAFNKGLHLATGDYVLFLNSDDALSNPSVLAQVACLIVENSSPMLLYGGFRIKNRATNNVCMAGNIVLSSWGIKHGKMLPHPCLFSKMEYFEKYGLFNESFRVAMDYEWFLRGALSENIVRIDLCTTDISEGGVSTKDRDLSVSEIIRALRLNGYYRTWLGSGYIKSYFRIRAFVRNVLAKMMRN